MAPAIDPERRRRPLIVTLLDGFIPVQPWIGMPAPTPTAPRCRSSPDTPPSLRPVAVDRA